jgi:recombination protein RecT
MTTAVTPRPPKPAPATIKGLLEGEAFRSAVSKALPRHLPPDRFIRVALTALMRTPKLAECDQASFFQALLSLSQMGLEPDGRRAHLIPFENRKRGVTECQLIVDYKGLVDLAMRSGAISHIHADVVCEHDEFEFDKGVLVHHRINFREDRGRIFATYAIVRFKDGGEKCEVMTRSEVEAVRARSRAATNGPWVTDWAEMAKKTAFRRLSKWLPLSSEFRDALEADADTLEEKRFDVAKPVFDAQTFLPAAPPHSSDSSSLAQTSEQSAPPATEIAADPETIAAGKGGLE